MIDWQFICPACKAELTIKGPTAVGQTAVCPQDNRVYTCIDGIWRFLPPDRMPDYETFIHEYETIRAEEGRGSTDSAYYRALPFDDLSGQMAGMWAIRAQSFRTLLANIIEPMAKKQASPLRIVDLGAGNGWLSYQLARRGHAVMAVDLLVNPWDGLATAVHYDAAFTPVQAEFNRLPIANAQADLVIFNASFHYATQYAPLLIAVKRLLRDKGQIIIVDTPIYHQQASGVQMVRERETQFRTQYGFPSNALASRNFLTYTELDALADTVGLAYAFHWPVARWRWGWRRFKSALRRQREPGQLPIIALRRP